MKLDERFKILPFCCFGTDKRVVTNHIGEKGYFANQICYFQDIKLCKYGTLGTVMGDQQESFYMSETEESFSFFIPECFVKPKEKKYRPFTLEEFQQFFTIGQPIKFRRKAYRELINNVMFIGYREDNMGLIVLLGNAAYSLEELFEQYEYFFENGKTWVLFGVEE